MTRINKRQTNILDCYELCMSSILLGQACCQETKFCLSIPVVITSSSSWLPPGSQSLSLQLFQPTVEILLDLNLFLKTLIILKRPETCVAPDSIEMEFGWTCFSFLICHWVEKRTRFSRCNWYCSRSTVQFSHFRVIQIKKQPYSIYKLGLRTITAAILYWKM